MKSIRRRAARQAQGVECDCSYSAIRSSAPAHASLRPSARPSRRFALRHSRQTRAAVAPPRPKQHPSTRSVPQNYSADPPPSPHLFARSAPHQAPLARRRRAAAARVAAPVRRKVLPLPGKRARGREAHGEVRGDVRVRGAFEARPGLAFAQAAGRNAPAPLPLLNSGC